MLIADLMMKLMLMMTMMMMMPMMMVFPCWSAARICLCRYDPPPVSPYFTLNMRNYTSWVYNVHCTTYFPVNVVCHILSSSYKLGVRGTLFVPTSIWLQYLCLSWIPASGYKSPLKVRQRCQYGGFDAKISKTRLSDLNLVALRRASKQTLGQSWDSTIHFIWT